MIPFASDFFLIKTFLSVSFTMVAIVYVAVIGVKVKLYILESLGIEMRFR